jgi:L-ribulose-5-phosphate 3-epimerase
MRTMLLGYNTNGFAFHRLKDAVRIMHGLGYGAVGITLDVHHLNPFGHGVREKTDRLKSRLDRLGMRCVVETGARFLLDPNRKHQPTLLDPNPDQRSRRTELLELAIWLAGKLNADAVSFWSGAAPEGDNEKEILTRLEGELSLLLAAAKANHVRLALEPEPGMAIATTEQGMEFVRRMGDPRLGLTIDVGHMHCLQEGDLPSILKSVGDQLFNVHIEDMRAGVHDHLMFGEGEMNFPPIFEALKEMNYQNGVYVELSRHAHDAVRAAEQALEFLKPLAST